MGEFWFKSLVTVVRVRMDFRADLHVFADGLFQAATFIVGMTLLKIQCRTLCTITNTGVCLTLPACPLCRWKRRLQNIHPPQLSRPSFRHSHFLFERMADAMRHE